MAVGVTIAGATLGYSLAPSPAVDVPDRKISFEGTEYNITHIGHVVPGRAISVEVDAPPGQSFDLYLYNGEREILDRHRDQAGQVVSFDIPAGNPNYRPGTYVLALEHDGVFKAIAPFVIAGFAVNVRAPHSAIDGESVPVTAELKIVNNSKAISDLQVVVGNETHQDRTTLVSQGRRIYTGTVSLNGLSLGNYSLYIVVRGNETVFGHREVLGISDPLSFRIRPDRTNSSPSPTGDSNSPMNVSDPGDTKGTVTAISSASSPTTSLSDGSPNETTEVVITPSGASQASRTTRTPGQNVGFMPPVIGVILLLWWVRR